MARPRIYTPEESQARNRESQRRSQEKHRQQSRARYNERYPTRYKANAKARHDARMAAMTPEELASYRAANAAATRRHRAKDPEAEQAQRLAYQRSHPDKHRAYSKQHRVKSVAKNPSYYKERYRMWRDRNPAAITEAAARRRARIRGAKRNDVTPAQRQAVIDAAHGVCAYCKHFKPACQACRKGTHRLTVDHITAIVNGGDNTLWNLIACCHSCNSAKNKRPNPVPVQPLLL
jgi:5-methylcytosine-specific restriction endonuclease McrA